MANPLRGEVLLPGTDLVLRYDVNALCEAEAAAGQNIPALLAQMEDGTPPSFTNLRLLLWAGVRGVKASFTVSEAGDLLQSVGIPAAITAISAAFRASFGPAEADPGKKA